MRALALEGYEVRAVSNGALALEALRVEPADLLLLDVSMPVVDGITVCRVLRGERNRVPILMLTARTEATFSVPSDAIQQGYTIVDLSREQFDDKPQHSGDSIMRGTLPV